mgnify:CR=1 FL=1
MKFNKQINNGTLLIPGGAFKISGFEGGEKVEIHTLDSAVVVLKKQMTTMELIQAMDALHRLATELTVHLARVCGTCDDCEDGCPFDDLEDGMLELPDYLPASLPGPSSVSMWMTKKRPSPLPRPDMTMTCGMCLPTCWRCWVKPESAWASWRNS